MMMKLPKEATDDKGNSYAIKSCGRSLIASSVCAHSCPDLVLPGLACFALSEKCITLSLSIIIKFLPFENNEMYFTLLCVMNQYMSPSQNTLYLRSELVQ